MKVGYRTIAFYLSLVPVALVLGFYVGHRSNAFTETTPFELPPETERYEEASKLLDIRLHERFLQNDLWKTENGSTIRAYLKDRFAEPFLRVQSIEERKRETRENGVALTRLTMKLADPAGGELSYNAVLLAPAAAPAPGILALHGMGSSIDAMLEDIDYHNGLGMELAEAGFAVLIPERLETDYEARAVLALKAFALGTSLESLELVMLETWLAYLNDHPTTVGKAAVHGTSIGGFHALLLTALNTDISAIYASGWVSDRFGVLFKRHPLPVSPPGEQYMRTFWKGDLGLYGWNMGPLLDDRNLISAISPTPLAIETGQKDTLKFEGSESIHESAREIYRRNQAEQNLTIHIHPGSHSVDTQAAIEWFQHHLGTEEG